MGNYIPSTPSKRREMLDYLGLKSTDDLFSAIPESIKVEKLNLPSGKGELAVKRDMEALAAKNTKYSVIFRGAGAYNRFIPAVVKSVISKEEFVTAYTPYQAEISQGILQSIFEYQTMLCELTGMDVSNASVYDGAEAAAEAVLMFRERKRRRVLISETVNPGVLETVKTYCFGANAELSVVPAKNGITDINALKAALDEESACFYMQQPNYFGIVEDAEALGAVTHDFGARFIMGVEPVSAVALKSPRECGADAAVGEAQPLGMPLSFGGPYLGFMTVTKENMRRLPGRIVGRTVDSENREVYVLTLQAREQHIRREKASSNICSNEALCALTASVYMCAMGESGMKEAAMQSLSNAHYLAKKLSEIPGMTLRYNGWFFNEFLTESPVSAEKIEAELGKHGILSGLPCDGGILWCATEMNNRAEIDKAVEIISEFIKSGKGGKA